MGGRGLFAATIQEIPTDLSLALSHALRILNWQENLTGDEMPPSWMWPLEHELELYFEELNREREERYGGTGSSRDEPEPEMMKNELAAERFHR